MSTPFSLEAKITVGMWLESKRDQTLTSGERNKIWADGVVISNHQGFGIGVKFLNLSRKALEELTQFLECLARQRTSLSL
jgi:hypothetical protein